MDRRERVVRSLNHQESDFIPYEISFTLAAHDKMAAATGDPEFEDQIGSHITAVGLIGGTEEVPDRPGYFRDFFGVLWNRSVDRDIGVVEQFRLPDPTLEGFALPEPDLETVRRASQELENRDSDCYKMVALGFSLFERAWTFRGMENLLMDMVLNPSFVEDLLDRICEFNLQVIDAALDYDFDGFYFGDDWGQQSGMIMGPGHWRRFIKPRVTLMYERVKSKGKHVIQHSCGDISPILSDLIEMGLDLYQTFQPEIYDISRVKQEYGRDLSFWGGISSQKLLAHGTPDEVRETTIQTMRIMGADGGYIVAPSHGVPGDIPVENVRSLVDVFQNQEKYL
ncbi:MAG: uroporphyrinogen decarboxylase [Candidatus Omnitrophica bacterium]|nr:uroporphyrinogen decarboxylase [Candidatus Omnitrophota bacterium]